MVRSPAEAWLRQVCVLQVLQPSGLPRTLQQLPCWRARLWTRMPTR